MLLDLSLGALTEVASGRHWTLPQIRKRIASRVHTYRALGLKRGDRVLVHFGNQIEIFVEILAIWRLGGCVIPIDARLTPFEVENLARVAQPRFSIVSDDPDASISAERAGTIVVHTAEHGHVERASEPMSGEPRLDDDALILFTSGTTGQPKGVVHTHRSLWARWIALRQAFDIQSFQRTLCVLPTHFGHGLICNCMFPWMFGCDLFVAPPFKPELLMQLGKLIDEHEITFMSSVPSMWSLALRIAKSPSKQTLRRLHIGSAPLSADLWRQVQDWARLDDVVNTYGITETGSWVAGASSRDLAPEDGLVGVPWGATIRVLSAREVDELSGESLICRNGEPGMIWLNSPALMKGYFQRDDLTETVVHQGWFKTGDIGFLDARGQLTICGRERDEINKGGAKVFPSDIDAVVQQFLSVTDVCAFGVEDELYGENVAIALVLQDQEAETIANLSKWISDHLTEYKRPILWYLLDEIPRTSRGKINRDTVREVCLGQEPLNLSKILQSVR